MLRLSACNELNGPVNGSSFTEVALARSEEQSENPHADQGKDNGSDNGRAGNGIAFFKFCPGRRDGDHIPRVAGNRRSAENARATEEIATA